MNYDISFAALEPYIGRFISGFEVTLEVSALALLISMPLGVGGALLRTSQYRPVAIATGAYVEVLRNVPLLVVVYVFFYGLPGIGIVLGPFVAGVTALSLNATAFAIEIFRGGLTAIPKGQYEAAYSLALRPYQVFAHVVLPQLVRITFPALGNQVVGLVLGSALVYVVGVAELTNVAYSVGSITFRYFEVFVVAAAFYFVAVQLIKGCWNVLGTRWIARGPVPGR